MLISRVNLDQFQVLRPDGSKVGLIPVPTTQGVTNCAFGGPDLKTLFVTAGGHLWSRRLDAVGRVTFTRQ